MERGRRGEAHSDEGGHRARFDEANHAAERYEPGVAASMREPDPGKGREEELRSRGTQRAREREEAYRPIVSRSEESIARIL